MPTDPPATPILRRRRLDPRRGRVSRPGRRAPC
jgi:hypothetical protein